MSADPKVLVPTSSIQALMAAVQEHLTNKQAATKLLTSLDAQLVASWQAFDRTLVPFVEPAPAADPVAAIPAAAPGN